MDLLKMVDIYLYFCLYQKSYGAVQTGLGACGGIMNAMHRNLSSDC